jgi:hypothetical protein
MVREPKGKHPPGAHAKILIYHIIGIAPDMIQIVNNDKSKTSTSIGLTIMSEGEHPWLKVNQRWK